ncbi:uncharacterized protein PSFLO_04392 [Pseudozyma flocculosa]|uniref:PX domain-containing protein YPT35 n=1 Tax=Pseudozyma flocculosa TaxID=84751 RepID=A0A5C3F312_9BASI|nr:uncharacterized protein PSFLO_04392 [Pseudozyma flocculosa]
MDDELARELQLATSDLLDLDALHLSAPSRPTSSHSRTLRPSIDIPAPTFSPESKLEPIYSPSDVRPPSFSPFPSRHASRVPHPGTTSTNHDGGEPSDDHEDHLPLSGLSSTMASVRGEQVQSIILTGPIHQTDTTDDDRIPPSSPSAGPSTDRPASGLRSRIAFDDVYLNEFGERVVNGKVVGRMRGGRRRIDQKTATPEPPDGSTTGDSAQSRPLTSLDSPFKAPAAAAPAAAVVASPIQRHAETMRQGTPPAFFLQSFPDALQPGRRAPSSKPGFQPAATVTPSADGAEGNPPGPALRAPKPTARALNFGGDDGSDGLSSDDDDMVSASSDAASSSSGHQASVAPMASRGAVTADLASSATLTAPGPTFIGIDRPTSRNSVASTSRGGNLRGGKLEIPSISRRATPTIEVSATQTEHLTLHGNKLQARRSERELGRVEDKVSTYRSTAGPPSSPPAAHTLGSRIESLFHTPLVPLATESSAQAPEGTWEDPPRWSSQRHSGAGTSISAPSSPTFEPRTRGHDDDDDDEGGDGERASLDSLPASLLSLPVSTITSSSHSASLASSLERRRSGGGGSISSNSRRRRGGRGRSEDATSTGGNGERFARDVAIRGWKQVGSQARGWVVFEIRIISKQVLCNEIKDQARYLPPLPSKRKGLLHKYDPRYLEARRKSLQSWIQIVMLDRIWGASDGLQRWVLEGE